jgi:ATP synthase F1 gamma subunit
MAIIANIKKDMDFYRNLSSLLKVLKGIAVAQFHILERKVKSFDKFHQTVENFLEEIDTGKFPNPFVTPRTDVMGVIAVTSDSGLLGGLNTQIMNLAINELAAQKGELIIVGDRGAVYAREEHIPFTGFPGIKDEEKFSLAFNLRNYIFKRVAEGNLGRVKIIYPVALSLIAQRREIVTILPYANAAKETAPQKINPANFILESSLGDIVEYLVFLWMGNKFYDVFGQSRLAELGARFMHLEESSHRLEDVDKNLKLQYFRTRHELTDRSMREIFAARMIYGN